MAFFSAPPCKLSCLAAALVISLAACGDGKEKKAATQVAAKVNGSEISVHQLNAVLAKAQGVSSENAPKVRQEILDKLIDQQLAYDQAVEKKLDRNPDTMMAIEAAKREVVVRAYLDQIVAALPKPTDEEVRKYYADNPDLFARRRVYSLQEITLEQKPDILGNLKQLVAAGKSLDDIANWLKSNGVQFRGGAASRTAEQIPLDVLPRVAELKDGQTGVIQSGQNFLVVRVMASQAEPVDEATAMPKIQQFLYNQRAQQAVIDEIKKLKSAAKIEYQGEFAGVPAAGEAKPPVPAAQGKPAGNNIEKGVAGLK